MSERYEFVWERPEGDAFVWADGRHTGTRERLLVARPDAAFRPYLPASGPAALYRVLAEVEPTEAGILAFVARYGRLGGPVEVMADLDTEPAHPLIWPELFSYWCREIAWLRETVRLWDMVREGDTDGLAACIKWEGKARVRYVPPPHLDPFGGIGPGHELYELVRPSQEQNRDSFVILDEAGKTDAGRSVPTPGSIRPGNVVRPALLFVMRHINGSLLRNVAPCVRWDDDRQRTVFMDLPANLYGFAYLQFAQAVYSERQPRRCAVCGIWYDLAPGVNRADRLTCSGTCRTKAYRERQEQARRLRAEGKTPSAVAKTLGTDAATVRKWLAQRKG